MGGPGKYPNPCTLLTFAPPLAIALDRQPLRVLLHPDHTRLLWNLWLRGAVGHDHVDLLPFKIQLSPLPHVNILHRRSRHNSKACIEMLSGRKAHSRNNRTWFHSSASCLPPCSVISGPPCLPTHLRKVWLLHLASLFERMHYPLEIGSLLLCDPGRGTQLFCYWFPSTEKRKGNTALQISLVGAWERDWSRNLTH